MYAAIARCVRPIIACPAGRPQWPTPATGVHSPRHQPTWCPLNGHLTTVARRISNRTVLRSLFGLSSPMPRSIAETPRYGTPVTRNEGGIVPAYTGQPPHELWTG
jgi:hypothetical protein